MVNDHSDSEKGKERKGNALFNDALNTFIYGYMVSHIW